MVLMGGTALDASGQEVYETPTHHYPLPPPMPGKFIPEFNGKNQYRLPDVKTGELKSYTRATTLAKVLDDTYMLHLWNVRKTLLGMAQRDDLMANLSQLTDEYRQGDISDDELREPLNTIADQAASAAGSNQANEFGSAVHDWTAYVDCGLISVHQVPDLFRPYVLRHLEMLAAAQLIVVPKYTERIVMSSTLGCVGTLDRILIWPQLQQVPTGLVLGDVKTSARLTYSWLSFAIQLAFYQSCDLMLSEDGQYWEDMPFLDEHVAMVVHLPSAGLDKAVIQPINLAFGREALVEAIRVRKLRSRAATEAPSTTDLTPDIALERWFSARLGVQTSASQDDLVKLWTEYQDVWTDDLTTMGNAITHTFNAKGHASS
jgi:hypothetical protein